MKTFRCCAALFSLAMGVLNYAVAQITITTADVSSSLSLGRSITGRTDTTRRTVNIGTLGSTSWNFNPLNSQFAATTTSVRPDTTPYFGQFPTSTHALRTDVGIGVSYTYYRIATNLFAPGVGQSGSFPTRIRYVPDQVTYQLPMTFGTNWTSTYAESSIVTLPPPLPPSITITNYTVSNSVDAYGSLTLPGGAVVQALRLRTDRRYTRTTGSGRIITYSFIANNGVSVSVNPADTLQPNTGNIIASSVSWSTGTTDVRLSDAVPSDFELMQNYPNPFNPTTTIEFALPTDARVTLEVYDVLGRRVAELVNGYVSAGYHEVEFNATSLASGIYFYRLNANDGDERPFTQMRKLMLMK